MQLPPSLPLRLVPSVLALMTATAPALPQRRPTGLEGTWRARVADTTYLVVVRPDSSASLGDQTVRWRVAKDSLLVALGEAWYAYAFRLERDRLVLSGGDLAEPMMLTRVGPPTPRPESVPLPPAPPRAPRPAW